MTRWMGMLLVGSGGGLGSIARYLTGAFVHQTLGVSGFPLGTAIVNVIGCFAIGLLGGLFEVRQAFGPEARLFLLVGVLGGFTTFSSYAYETLALARDAEFARAAINVVAQTALGLAGAWLGYALVRA